MCMKRLKNLLAEKRKKAVAYSVRLKMTRKAYNLALSIYSHVRHGDFIGAKHLLAELVIVVDELLKKEENDRIQ